MIKTFFTLAISFLLSYSSFSQENGGKEITQTIYYSFSNAKSIDQVDKLKSNIEELDFVVKVKSEFKAEKEAGQVVVIVKDIITQTEDSGQAHFDVHDLKRLMIENHLRPNKIQIETIKK